MAANDDKPPKKPPHGGGGVAHDARGNAVWKWAVDSGRFAIDSTSRLLKRLEVPGLKLEDEDKPAAGETVDPHSQPQSHPHSKHPASAKSTAKINAEVGYDPYGGSGGQAKRPPPAIRKPAAAPAARPSLLSRLFRKD
jgi:hypothetical protein